MKDKLFGVLQKMGRSFLLPIAVLPVAGLLLGIGSTLTSSGYIPEDTFIYKLLCVLGDCGDMVFGILPLLLCVAVALGLARQYKEVAAISAVFGYFVMNMANSSIVNHFMDVEELSKTPGLLSDFLGFTNCMNTSVLGGVILGVIVAKLTNKFHSIKLPELLAFFGGLNFVPIISTVAGIVLGISMTLIWPYAAALIAMLGVAVSKMGYVGTFLYGFIYRLLIPTGLHHVFYLPFWQTAIGGTEVINGAVFYGSQNIMIEQIRLGLPITAEVGRFYSGEFAMMMFGLPGAALSMYHTAHKENKKKAKGLLLSAALASFLTGITEPIEFSFLFVAPFLYFGVHSVLAGACFMIGHIIGAGVCNNFSAGALDFMIYGVMLGNERTKWIYILILGIVMFVVYYIVFRFLIVKFNLKTPGREDSVEEVRLHSKKEYLESSQNKYQKLLEGLGGLENILDIDACASRLRLRLANGNKIDEALLKQTGSLGVVKKENNVQVVYGPKVSTVRIELENYISAIKGKEG